MAQMMEFITGLGITELFKSYIANGRIILDYFHILFDKLFYFFLYIAIAFTSVYLILSLFAVFSRKESKEKPFNIKKAPSVTIQIPTRNENIAIRCAKRCLVFDYPKNKYEILIGDDSNDASVSEELNAFARQHEQVKVLKRKANIGFKPGNLNNLLKYSKGDILVLFDSDFTPEKDFLKRIVTPFIYDNKIAAVQARWNFNNFNQNKVTMLASTIVYIFHHIVLSFMNLFNSGSLCGSAEAIKKKDLIELGGWRSGSLTEDIEYSLRLHKHQKKIKYLPKLECYSDVPYLAKDLYKQQMRWAYGVINSYMKHSSDLIINKPLSIKQRILSFCAGFGYCMPVLISLLFITGTLSFVTHRPESFDFVKFFSELGINVLLTSGLLIASLISLYKEKKISYALKTLYSSFSIGLVTTYYVNKGIFKSIFKKPMQWYLLNKDINYVKD